MQQQLKAGTLVWLLAAALLTTAVTFARYTTGAYAADTARVAGFHVEMEGGGESVTLDGTKDEMTGTYPFSITSTSEVAVEYTIRVVFEKAPPEGITLTIDDGVGQDTNGETKEFDFAGGKIEANDKEAKSHTLTITGDPDTLTEDFSDTVSVHVTATQAE